MCEIESSGQGLDNNFIDISGKYPIMAVSDIGKMLRTKLEGKKDEGKKMNKRDGFPAKSN